MSTTTLGLMHRHLAQAQYLSTVYRYSDLGSTLSCEFTGLDLDPLWAVACRRAIDYKVGEYRQIVRADRCMFVFKLISCQLIGSAAHTKCSEGALHRPRSRGLTLL